MLRRVGLLLCGLGLLVLAWVGVILLWGDPVTSLYTRHEQHELAGRLDVLERNWRQARPTAVAATTWQDRAGAFRRSLRPGDPLGRIVIPRIGLDMVVVEGTGTAELRKGPGHYDARTARATSLPGLGGVVAIAGHRTTFEHPFRLIDHLHTGDAIVLEMPYGTFTYRVTGYRVVVPTDWSILRPRPWEKLVLTACHPLYSASHRYAVFARLAVSRPGEGRGGSVPPKGEASVTRS